MTESISGQLVQTLEIVWDTIRDKHNDVPAAVITIGSGTLGARPGQQRLGHFAAGRWQHGDDERLPELFVSGEGLQRGAVEVLGTLLHEAAHGMAHTRQIKETSRQGRYHNRKFRDLGHELGLALEEDRRIGWSITQMPPTTAADYAEALRALTAALVAYRHAEETTTKAKKGTNLAVASCACPRKIRVAISTLKEAPITCGACEHDFVADEEVA